MKRVRIMIGVLLASVLMGAVPALCAETETAAHGSGTDVPAMTEQSTEAEVMYLSQAQCAELSFFSQYACRAVMGDSWEEDTVWAESLTAQQQAFLLFWYQYNMSDDRVIRSEGEWNRAVRADLEEILQEMFGEALQEDALSVFLEEYVDHWEEETACMPCSGDFGDVGLYYFEPAVEYWKEGELIAVRGRVMSWNENMHSYVHQDMYIGYFGVNPSKSDRKTAYRLDHVAIGF